MSKIDSRTMGADRVDAAKKIAEKHGGQAYLALELISFDKEVTRAMQHVFGSTIICSSSDVAKAVAFDKGVRAKTITFEGDVYDPSGTLSGGSSNNLGRVLKAAHTLSITQASLDKEMAEYKKLSAALKTLAKSAEQAEKLSSQLELKQHALSMKFEDKISQSDYTLTESEIDACKAELAQCEVDKVAHTRDALAKAKAELKRLETVSSNIKKEREAAMKRVENEMKAAQKKASDTKKALTSLKGREML